MRLLLAALLAFGSSAPAAAQDPPPGIKEAMQRFKQVMTIESNWSDSYRDDIIDEDNRRYAALAMLLRARYLVDVDCFSEVRGQPIRPSAIRRVISRKLERVSGKVATS